MKIDIKLTEEDIASGRGYHGEYHACPIAQHLKRIGFENLQVDNDYILASKDGKSYKYKTPTQAQVFIEDFDDGKEVVPIEFELDSPETPRADDYFCNRWPNEAQCSPKNS